MCKKRRALSLGQVYLIICERCNLEVALVHKEMSPLIYHTQRISNQSQLLPAPLSQRSSA